MANEKIFKDEVLKKNELNNVAGGKRYEIYDDGHALYRRGLLNEEDKSCFAKVSDAIHNLGYKYEIHGVFKGNHKGKNNEYFNKKGESVSRKEFWKNFDAENGTKIIR